MRAATAVLALISVAALTMAAPAVAGPIYSVSGGSLQNGSDQVTITRPDGVVETGLAGQVTIQITDMATQVVKTVQAYCTDIFDYLHLPDTFTQGLLSDTVKDATKVAQINALITNGNAGAITNDASAALQMAIWEIENDTATATHPYDVTTGTFMASGPANALALANQDIQNVLNGVWKADPQLTIYQITAPNNQSLSYAEAVPEPATLLMFGTGLLILVVLRRTKRSPFVGMNSIAA